MEKMIKIDIEFSRENQSFIDNPAYENQNILATLARLLTQIETASNPRANMSITDANGNKIGSIRLTEFI